MNIGNNISALRKEKGITQEELARALGLSAQAISKWENNSSCPDVSLLAPIADYFGVTVDDLLRADEDKIIRDKIKPEESENNLNCKKSIHIKIVQKNGKENNIKIPFKFARMGLNLATTFGLDNEAADKISAIISQEKAGNIFEITTESEEHITIMLAKD